MHRREYILLNHSVATAVYGLLHFHMSYLLYIPSAKPLLNHRSLAGCERFVANFQRSSVEIRPSSTRQPPPQLASGLNQKLSLIGWRFWSMKYDWLTGGLEVTQLLPLANGEALYGLQGGIVRRKIYMRGRGCSSFSQWIYGGTSGRLHELVLLSSLSSLFSFFSFFLFFIFCPYTSLFRGFYRCL